MSPSPLAERTPWNLVAAGYNAHSRAFMDLFSQAAVDLLAPQKTQTAVDVACGPGTTSLLLAPHVEHVQALDFSPKMLEQFERNLAQSEITNVSLTEGDGQALPYEDETFDLGVSMFGLMFFPNRSKGFSELFRVLKPGGKALVSSWAPVDRSTAMQAVVGALQAADPSRTGGPRDPTTLENPEVLQNELHEAGFSEVTVSEVERGVTATEGGLFWDEMSQGCAPVALIKEQLSADEWTQQNARARDYLVRNVSGGTLLSSVAYFGVGTKK